MASIGRAVAAVVTAAIACTILAPEATGWPLDLQDDSTAPWSLSLTAPAAESRHPTSVDVTGGPMVEQSETFRMWT